MTEQALGYLDDAWRIATPEHADPVQPAARGRVPAGPGPHRGRDPRGGYGERAWLPSPRDFEPSKVGGRLREERERLGISLRELARRVGVSPSLVSQIELDRVNPSVSTLYSLVTELGMTMSDVFGDAEPAERVVRQPRGDGLAERPDTRRVINLASGVRWERLTPSQRHATSSSSTSSIPVGAESCPEDALTTHGGREYGYVSSGTLGVQVGFERVRARPGRLDRVRLVVAAPAVGDRRRARPRDLGRDRPRGRSAHAGARPSRPARSAQPAGARPRRSEAADPAAGSSAGGPTSSGAW